MQMMQLLLIAVVGLLLVTAENTTVVGNATATSADKPDVALYGVFGAVGGIALVFIVWYAMHTKCFNAWLQERDSEQAARRRAAENEALHTTDRRSANRR